jgi:hypothetical protein
VEEVEEVDFELDNGDKSAEKVCVGRFSDLVSSYNVLVHLI